MKMPLIKGHQYWKFASMVMLAVFISCIALFTSACLPTAHNGETVIEPSDSPPPTPTPLPTPTFDDILDNGDIVVNDWFLRQLHEKRIQLDRAPVILIYHTHASEAFLMDEDYTYEPSAEYRTLDNDKNIVRVGALLAQMLEDMGCVVWHDTSNVEEPELTSAYSRSLAVMQQYESIDLYIDLHRNAADVERRRNDVAILGGLRCARVFCVVGTGVGTYEDEYDVLPDWESNYGLAMTVTNKLQTAARDLAKPIRTKPGRHNQHVGNCLLIELGHNANTMQECENTLPYLAAAIYSMFE